MKLYNDDCLNILKSLPDESIECIITDPPYGKYKSFATDHSQLKKINWDFGLDWDNVSSLLYKVIKPQHAVILFAQDEFTYILYEKMLNAGFKLKHHWYWKKSNAPNFMQGKYEPLKIIEDILVFFKPGKEKFKYFTPEVKIKEEKLVKCKFYDSKNNVEISSEQIFELLLKNDKTNFEHIILSAYGAGVAAIRPVGVCKSKLNLYNILIDEKYKDQFIFDFENKILCRKVVSYSGYPKNVIEISNVEKDALYKRGPKHHPTQKPVELLKFLIEHYSLEDDVILDFTMGSGSTGVACKKTNRNFIGIELMEHWYNIAKERIEKE